MNTQEIGSSSIKASRIAYGCMAIGGSWDRSPIDVSTRRRALATLETALEQGINFFDHADIYCMGKSEEVFANLWQKHPRLRQKIYLQSKCGIRFGGDPYEGAPQRYDFSYEHILRSVEGSLKRLQTEYLDVLLLHRPDPLVEPEEVARAFDNLYASGKVLNFGVSNHTAAQIALLQKNLNQPIIANQLEISLLHTHLFDEGIVANQDEPPYPARNEGTMEYCRQHDITLQAWGPLAYGKVSGRALESPTQAVTETAQLVAEMAREKNVGKEAILIAWLLSHPAQIQPVIGTTKPERIASACQADAIELIREEWYRLFVAGRGHPLP